MTLLRYLLSVILGVFLFSATMAMAQAVDPAAPVTATEVAPSSAPVYQYRLGSGDKVRVIIFGEESLSGEYAVSGEGKLSLPLIGEVQAAGLSVAQLQEAIQSVYKQGYLNDPRVSIEVQNFRPFFILGEVKQPGQYPYSNGLTVLNAVALAQGFTYRANQTWVYIKRVGTLVEEKQKVTPTLSIQPGDTIRIVERYF